MWVLRAAQGELHLMGGFGGMHELAPLCALFSCTIILMTSVDDEAYVHLKGQMAIYKPSAAARARLGDPYAFGSANVAIFHVDAYQVLQYLSSAGRPTTILIELGDNHCRGFLGPAQDLPLSHISLASSKPFRTSDEEFAFVHSPLRESYSKVKELQTEDSQACVDDMAARRAGLAGALSKLKRARKAAQALNAAQALKRAQAAPGHSKAPPSRTNRKRKGKTAAADKAVDNNMSVHMALTYVSKWEKLRNQDRFKRPWPVRRQDARERPGASASAEREGNSSDSEGRQSGADDGGNGADESGGGADAGKAMAEKARLRRQGKAMAEKLPREAKVAKVARVASRAQQDSYPRTEQTQGALVPTRIAAQQVVAAQLKLTTAILVKNAAEAYRFGLQGDEDYSVLAHGRSTCVDLVSALSQEEDAMSVVGWGVLCACYNFFVLQCLIFEAKTGAEGAWSGRSAAWPLPRDGAFSVKKGNSPGSL